MINYREEEKRILDEILGKGVYDNRIRPSGTNGTGNRTISSNFQDKHCQIHLGCSIEKYHGTTQIVLTSIIKKRIQ